MKKTIYIIAITISILLIGCGKVENNTTYEHTDSFVRLEVPNNESNSTIQEEATQDNKNNTVTETVEPIESPSTNPDYDEEREKLMQWIKEDTQRIVDSIDPNTPSGPPNFREATPEDFDIHCEIKNYNEIDEEKLEIFIIAGYPDDFFNVASTFVEECNITTKIEYSDAGTNLEMNGYDCIILHANNTDYLIFYNDTEMFIKEI